MLFYFFYKFNLIELNNKIKEQINYQIKKSSKDCFEKQYHKKHCDHEDEWIAKVPDVDSWLLSLFCSRKYAVDKFGDCVENIKQNLIFGLF